MCVSVSEWERGGQSSTANEGGAHCRPYRKEKKETKREMCENFLIFYYITDCYLFLVLNE